MTFIRVGAVLLSCFLIVACRGQASQDNVPFYSERSYRLKEITIVSSDGSLLVQLADDVENNRSKSGKNFWVHVRKLSVDDSNLSSTGTYIWVRGARGMDGEPDLSRVYEAKISVRKAEQRKTWEDFLAQQKDVLYGPKDVLPSESNPETR